jgi:hypothetical protein
MKEMHQWPIGSAILTQDKKEIPTPHKLIGEVGGYCFYKTRHGIYAIIEENAMK